MLYKGQPFAFLKRIKVNKKVKVALRISGMTTVILITFSILASPYMLYNTLQDYKEAEAQINILMEENNELNKKVEEETKEKELLITTISSNEEKVIEAEATLKNVDDIVNNYEHTIKTMETNFNTINQQNEEQIKYLSLKLGREIDNSLPNRGSTQRVKMVKVKFEVTMYTNAGGAPPYKGLMANGEYTTHGVVAAPKSIPFGTEVMFDNLPSDWEKLNRIHTVKDRGGAIVEKVKNGEKVYCIDVWTNNHKEAMNWGRRIIEGWFIYK